ncbi:D-amino acid dehydrogenase 2 [Neoasaia chiangmaiensis]|nr:D-amino acid dehydrogenase [Neoasaia chiangmaiensis]GEN14236.1 D-amino acid dehydrogenase 2 [Neoasaia chiangmaiensis]
MKPSQTMVVVGGGVVGLSTAYALLRRGFAVTLIEAAAGVGRKASYANGGQLSYRYVSPLADAGVPLAALQWMRRADSPIALTLRADFRQWRWLLAFLRACRAETNRRNAEQLLTLALHAQTTLGEWRNEGLEPFAWRRAGKLIIHRQGRALNAAAKHIVQPELQQVLDDRECIGIEPALAGLHGRFAGGIYTPGEEVADCAQFCQALLTRMEAMSHFAYRRGNASFVAEGDRIGVHVNGMAVEADGVVAATGLETAALLRRCGIDLPIYGLKGYSLTVPDADGAVPEVSVTDYANRVVYARIGTRLRAAAMVDIGAADAEPNLRRIAQLKALAQDIFPQASRYENAEAWAGFRPATPTGLPIVGRSERYRNMFINTGQGALGFTLAPACGELIADIASGTRPVVPLAAFAPS